MPISQTVSYFKNLYYGFLEEPMAFLLALKRGLVLKPKKRFPLLRQKPTQILA